MVPESTPNKSKEITAASTTRACGIWTGRYGRAVI
jgi:hypothetical protein